MEDGSLFLLNQEDNAGCNSAACGSEELHPHVGSAEVGLNRSRFGPFFILTYIWYDHIDE